MHPIVWLLPQLFYRGRDLVANNLVASTLWHKFNVNLMSFIFVQDTIESDLLYCIFLYKKGDKAWLI